MTTAGLQSFTWHLCQKLQGPHAIGTSSQHELMVASDDCLALILHLAFLPKSPGASCHWDTFSTWAYGGEE